MQAMSTMLGRSRRVLDTLEQVFLGINIFVVFAMMAVVVYGVIMRYVFNFPLRWVAELSEFMMVALTFLALAHVQRERKHIRITFLVERQSQKTKTIINVATTLVALFTFVMLTWASWGFAVKAWRSGYISDAAAMPLFPPRLLVPLGAGVMCLQLLSDLVQGVGSLLGTDSKKDEKKDE